MAMKRWTESDAREALAAWRKSGKTLAAFARDRGVDAQRIAWWRKRLGDEERAELVPVVVRAVPAGATVRIGGCEVEIAELSPATASWIVMLARALREER